MQERRHFDEKPEWFDKEMREMREALSKKADASTVETVIKYGIGAICAGAVSILGLYVLYYSGLSDLKAQVQVIDSKLSDVREDVTNIKRTLTNAEITK